MFSEGGKGMNDEEGVRLPSTSTRDENVDEEKKIVLVSRRITVREINISTGSCRSIFTYDLGREILTKITQFRLKTSH